CAADWSQQQRPSKNRSGSVPSCSSAPPAATARRIARSRPLRVLVVVMAVSGGEVGLWSALHPVCRPRPLPGLIGATRNVFGARRKPCPSGKGRSALEDSALLRDAQAAPSRRWPPPPIQPRYRRRRPPCDDTTWPPLATGGVLQHPPTSPRPVGPPRSRRPRPPRRAAGRRRTPSR